MIKTTTGAAQSVAVAIDKAQWPEVVGTHLRGRHHLHRDRQRARAAGSSSRLRELFRV